MEFDSFASLLQDITYWSFIFLNQYNIGITSQKPWLKELEVMGSYDDIISCGAESVTFFGSWDLPVSFFAAIRWRLVGYITEKSETIPVGCYQEEEGYLMDQTLSLTLCFYLEKGGKIYKTLTTVKTMQLLLDYVCC